MKHTKIKTPDQEILTEALKVFRKTTGLTADVQSVYDDSPSIRVAFQDQYYDAMVIKNSLPNPIVVSLLGHNLRKKLLIAKYIPSGLADMLKEKDILFLDTVGNAYINDPPLFVFVKGNKPDKPLCSETPMRIFRPAGLKIIFAILCNPGLENAPFRKIAKAATVALGSVGVVMNELKQTGYLIDMGRRGRRLVRKEDLLKRWVISYPEQLRPKQVTGFYRVADGTPWEQMNLSSFEAQWGGEVAAAILTGYLKPIIATIYMKNPIGAFLLKNRLRKDPHGNIEIIRPFWKFEGTRSEPLVHPLLIYADLLASDDPRNIETAEIIYERELARFICEN